MNGKLEDKLCDYLEDAHAMEQGVLRMLDSLIEDAGHPEIRRELEHHRAETELHVQRLRDRLEALGRSTSMRKEAQSLGIALMKGLTDQLRTDKAGKNARDAYVTEHMEIAAYELLERLAARAGDRVTAELARKNCRDEQAMAEKIEARWDTFLELTLREAGIETGEETRV